MNAAPPATAVPRPADFFPAEGMITQRGVLTVRGRQFTLNGYLAQSPAGGRRLIVTENFGSVLADVLVKPDGAVHVMRSGKLLRSAWIKRYVAPDMQCIFGNHPGAECPVRVLSQTHFVVERRWYTLDLQIVEIKAGPQPRGNFEETRKELP